jgi:P4 family phage/plasmid primase-like protien
MSFNKSGQNSFHAFIQNYRTVKSSAFTHTSMMSPIASFYIPGPDEEKFLKLYNEALERNEKLHMTEKHRDISPILIDLDFRYPNEKTFLQRQYSMDSIKSLIKVYLEEVSQYVDESKFEVYIMEKSKPIQYEKKNVIKDGVHIVIPNIVTNLSLQLMLREQLLSKLSFIEEEAKCINKIDDIVDKAVIDKNNWMMYGSCKPYNEPYLITNHITFNINDDNEITEHNNRIDTEKPWMYTEILSIRNKYEECIYREDKREFIENMEYAYQDQKIKRTIINKSQQSKENKKVTQSCSFELAEQLVDVLNVARADNYDSWIRVGWCCRNIDNRLLKSWVSFSKKSSKFVDEDECEQAWRYMKESGLGIGTLCMWAKSDNPELYEKIISQSLYSCLMASSSGTDYDIATVIYHKFKQDFVCSSIRNKGWYFYTDHRWVKCEDGYLLKKMMSTDMSKEYYRIGSDIAIKMNEITDPDEQSMCQKKRDRFNGIGDKLKKTDFKDKMLKESALHFFNEKFEDELLDANTNLIGFLNGVYDLSTMEFREGHPEDYISYSTKINYVEYNPDDPYIDQIMDFMSKVLPKKEVREYVLTLMASMLDGNNKEEKFYIWTGHGSNGKSKCIELLEKVLGDYACTFNISLLTSKRVGSSQTNSELVRAKGRRFAVLQEPEEGEKMNAGFMKELSGNDKIIARGLYKESIEFKPQFKMVLTCNHLPQVPPEDGGTWRRIRLVEFTSHFCENPNPENENEFHIDRELAFKFDDWKESFMGLLIHYYKSYKEFGIHEPEDVLKCTRQYQRSNDVIGEFMDAFIKKEAGSKVDLDDIYEEYKEWYKTESIPGKVLRRKGLRDYLDKNLVKPTIDRTNVFYEGCALKFSYSGKIANFGDEEDDL